MYITIAILISAASQCYCFQGIIYRVALFAIRYDNKQYAWKKTTNNCYFKHHTFCQESDMIGCCFIGNNNQCYSNEKIFFRKTSELLGSSEAHDVDSCITDTFEPTLNSVMTFSALESTSSKPNVIPVGSNSRTYSICEYHTVSIPTSYTGLPNQSVIVEDLTPIVNKMIQQNGIKNGLVTICSRHTTTSITINEYESRLIKDIENVFLTKVMPPDRRSISRFSQQSNMTYCHNDIQLRPETDVEKQRCLDNGWNVTNSSILQDWREQEPINAHSHLLSMLIGTTESIPIHDSKMILGQWQSILLIDFDGPRNRTVGIQLMGFH
jgi:thiamine phosphate synthase YjbQ (UPF0047 family)